MYSVLWMLCYEAVWTVQCNLTAGLPMRLSLCYNVLWLLLPWWWLVSSGPSPDLVRSPAHEASVASSQSPDWQRGHPYKEDESSLKNYLQVIRVVVMNIHCRHCWHGWRLEHTFSFLLQNNLWDGDIFWHQGGAKITRTSTVNSIISILSQLWNRAL